MDQQLSNIIKDVGVLLPEAWLLLLSTIILFLGVFKRSELSLFIKGIAIAGLLLNYYLIHITSINFPVTTSEIMGTSMTIYQHTYFFQYIFTSSALLAITLGLFGRKLHLSSPTEYTGVLLIMLLGLYLLSKSANFLMLYLSIEIVSFCSYMLTYFKMDKWSAEGSLKYLLFGAFSTACMLYGMSLIYAFTGHVTFSSIPEIIINAGILPAQLAIGLILIGLFFKLAAFPLQGWVPDTYQAAPTPFIAFLSVAPKAGTVYILFIISQHITHTLSYDFLKYMLALAALGSILIGNLSALWQKNAKRLLAYSSIAHTGFLLLPVINNEDGNIDSLLFYTCIFLLMNTAAFYWVHFMEIKLGTDKIEVIKGCGKVQPYPAVLLLIIMISLTGLPITAGFTAKLLIFSDLWQSISSGDTLLFILFFAGLLNVIIALYYYLQLPFYAFFKNPPVTSLPLLLNVRQASFLSILTLPLIIFFFKPDWLLKIINLL